MIIEHSTLDSFLPLYAIGALEWFCFRCRQMKLEVVYDLKFEIPPLLVERLELGH